MYFAGKTNKSASHDHNGGFDVVIGIVELFRTYDRRPAMMRSTDGEHGKSICPDVRDGSSYRTFDSLAYPESFFLNPRWRTALANQITAKRTTLLIM